MILSVKGSSDMLYLYSKQYCSSSITVYPPKKESGEVAYHHLDFYSVCAIPAIEGTVIISKTELDIKKPESSVFSLERVSSGPVPGHLFTYSVVKKVEPIKIQTILDINSNAPYLCKPLIRVYSSFFEIFSNGWKQSLHRYDIELRNNLREGDVILSHYSLVCDDPDYFKLLCKVTVKEESLYVYSVAKEED